MRDPVFEGFLKRQFEEGMALAEASDLLELIPLSGNPPYRYRAHFRCKGLIQMANREVVEADSFTIGIQFLPDYLRYASTFEALYWLEPYQAFHPNIQSPFICIGHLDPGTSLEDIVYRCFEVITYHKVTMREDDALNKEACAWARENQHRFPIDRRPLKRRALPIELELVEGAG